MAKDYYQLIPKALEEGDATKAQLTRRLGVSISCLNPNIFGGKILSRLVELGTVKTYIVGKTTFYSLANTSPPVKEEDLPSDSGEAEDQLVKAVMAAVKSFLQFKKKELGVDAMQTAIDRLAQDKEYFENLCKEYKAKIDELETKQAGKRLKLW